MTLPGIYRAGLDFERGFTRIPNYWLRDSRISFKAKGLLAYLLSHEVGYTITLGQIERETGDGKSAIRATVSELESAGYLMTQRTTDERGYNAGLAWFLQDPNPKCENPTLENPTLENRTALEENLIKNKTNKETYAQDKPEREDDFFKFWYFYPRKAGKGAARRAFFKAVNRNQVAEILDGAKRLSEDPNLPEVQYIPYPATWLNAEGWLNEPYPERKRTAEELEQIRAEKYARDREASLAAAKEIFEQNRAAESRAVPAPLCEHGSTIVRCKTCLRKMSDSSDNLNK